MTTLSRCVICEGVFEPGDTLQAFLRSTDDPEGSWTPEILVDKQFQDRHACNQDKIARKHGWCDEPMYECSGCGAEGEANYEGDRYYCGGSPNCCP